MTEQQSVLDKTRSTLLCRLKDLDHSDGWREFFDLYWLFIFRIADGQGFPLSCTQLRYNLKNDHFKAKRKGNDRCGSRQTPSTAYPWKFPYGSLAM